MSTKILRRMSADGSSSSSDSEPQEAYDLEDAQNSESDNERNEIRGELKNMTFEELAKLKEELGSKIYNEAVFGTSSKKREAPKKIFKRENKNRPREICAKRQVPLVAKTKQASSEVRDPRFDDKCGDFDSNIFKNNYEFVNDVRKREIKLLKKNLKRAKDEKKNEMKLIIQRLENQIREEEKRKKKELVLREEKAEIKKALDEGMQPYYPKKKERRAKELVQQFVELKESGKLVKHLEKRRKKNAAKDRKKINVE